MCLRVQGTLVGKVLTKADVEHCRVALPRLAMEANMPEVVDADTLHVVSTYITQWETPVSCTCTQFCTHLILQCV